MSTNKTSLVNSEKNKNLTATAQDLVLFVKTINEKSNFFKECRQERWYKNINQCLKQPQLKYAEERNNVINLGWRRPTNKLVHCPSLEKGLTRAKLGCKEAKENKKNNEEWRWWRN